VPNPPRLIQNIRNAMMEKDVIFESADGKRKVARWDHIVETIPTT